MQLSFSTFLIVSHIIPGPTVYISRFSRFTVFLDIFQVLPCDFLIFLGGQFSCHIPYPTVFVFHFPPISVFLAIFRILSCEFLIFSFSSFINIFHILHFLCFIFHVFQFFHHSPGPTLCFSHLHIFQCFSPYFRSFFSFLAIIQVLQCVFLICRFFSISLRITGPST